MLAALLVSSIPSDAKWVNLFDGKSLKGWTAKIKGYDLGDNFANTFRVDKGVIQVSYDGYGGKFDSRFGHLFYKKPFSKYALRLEYRFIGKQLPDGPGWAYQNSGVMIHSQDPKTIGKDQDFPISSEVQFLGGDVEGPRFTGNLCTPGTNVVLFGKLFLPHCIDSTVSAVKGDEWVGVEVECHGSGKVIHRVNGNQAITYEQVQYDERDALTKPFVKGPNLLISGGYIALQSESHPIEFRNVMIMDLTPKTAARDDGSGR